jgi:hypothetical protein
MKKKTILFVVSLILLVFVYWYLKNVYGWKEFRKNTDTPKNFMSHTAIKKEDYIKDSILVLSQLRKALVKHEDFFYSKAYFDSTELIIDSILYSPEYNKLAVLVITKNPTYRQLAPDKSHNWYYDATSYLGIRQKDTIALTWIGPSFTNSNNQQDISNDIREACFRTFVTKQASGEYLYNLNDKRFWASPIWKAMEETIIKSREFEEEKKKHPENVFEPKK